MADQAPPVVEDTQAIAVPTGDDSDVASTPATPAPPAKPLVLEVLHVVKTAQNLNGLRHGNYLRYRKYCSRKIHRIRVTLGITQVTTKRKQKREKEKEPKVCANAAERTLMLPLFLAERAWSYAMQLKEEASDDNSRVKFHLLRRLTKATKWSSKLQELCASSGTDDRTLLEAEAYSSWMNATLLLEREKYEEALERFLRARTIYSELSKVAEPEQQEEFKQRVDEIDPSIRFCNFNIGGQSQLDIQKLVALRKQDGGATFDFLSAKLETVLEETRKRQTDAMQEIKWRGKVIPIKSEKIRVALMKAQELTFELDRLTDPEAKLSLFTQLFICHGEALQEIRAELKNIAAEEKKAAKTEVYEQNMLFLQKYVSYLKLTRTIERNMILAENSRIKNRTELGSGEGSERKKIHKPEELVRLYETLLENMSDLKELRNPDDVEQEKEIVARTLSFKAYRTFFVALSYSATGKWVESAALLDRCLQQIQIAVDHHHDRATPSESDLQKLEQLRSNVASEKCLITAAAHLEAVEQENSASSGQAASSSAETQVAGNTLLESANVWTTQFLQEGRFVEFPPEFTAAPCKPILFDIALLACEFPSLEQKKAPPKKAGGFWGFWRS